MTVAWVACAAPDIDVAAGYRPDQAGLVIGADGESIIVLLSINANTRHGMLEFLRLDRTGTLLHRRTIETSTSGPSDLHIAALGNGRTAVFLPDRSGQPVLGQLLHLASDGNVSHRANIGHPTFASADYLNATDTALYANVMRVERDDRILLGGGYGSGPYIPWWGCFAANGTKLVEGDGMGVTPGPGVMAASFDADGGLRLVTGRQERLNQFDAVLGTYTAKGELTTRRILLRRGGEVASATFTDKEIALIADDFTAERSLRFFDRDGVLLRTLPLTGESWVPDVLLGDGEDLIGLKGVRPARTIKRIDRNGRTTWISRTGDYLALAGGADGRWRVLEAKRDTRGNYRLELTTLPTIP